MERKDQTLDTVRAKFSEYWPDAEMPDSVRQLWTRRLKNLNMNDLYESLDEVRVKYSSKTPQLKWVMEAYYEINGRRRTAPTQSVAEIEKEQLDQRLDEEAEQFMQKVEKDLTMVSEDEKCRAAEALPFAVKRKPAEWGRITKGLVWQKLFGSSRSNASRSPSLGLGPPV